VNPGKDGPLKMGPLYRGLKNSGNFLKFLKQYTSRHPDIIRLKNSIAALERQTERRYENY